MMPEPVFAAPFVSTVMRIEPPWIDYNGHLNVAYYNVLFDRAVDEVYEVIGLGPAYLERHKHSTMVVEAHVRYLRELKLEDPVRVAVQLMTTKKVAPFHDSVLRLLERMKAAHAVLPRPDGAGRSVKMPGTG